MPRFGTDQATNPAWFVHVSEASMNTCVAHIPVSPLKGPLSFTSSLTSLRAEKMYVMFTGCLSTFYIGKSYKRYINVDLVIR